MQSHDAHDSHHQDPRSALERKLSGDGKTDSEEAISRLWEEMALEDGMHWMPAMGAEDAKRREEAERKRTAIRKKPLVSACSDTGGCDYMEDDVFVSGDGTFVGVFDGHGGEEVARRLCIIDYL